MKKINLFILFILSGLFLNANIVLASNDEVNWKINGSSLASTITDIDDSFQPESITRIVFSDTTIETEVEECDKTADLSTDGNENTVVACVKDATLYVQYDGMLYLNESAERLFDEFTNTENIVGLNYINTSRVEVMDNMFYNLSSLEEIDLSNFNTTSVNSMYSMFDGIGVSTLDLSSFDTKNVTNMSYMFNNTDKLVTLNLGENFDTSNVEYMNYMFGSTHLSQIDLSGFNTSKVKKIRGMFSGSNIENINLSSFNTSTVNDMSYLFSSAEKLETITFGENFVTSNVTDMSYMFNDAKRITTLDLSKFNTTKVEDMTNMFYNMQSLTNLDITKFDTTNVTSMEYAFGHLDSLETIDLSKINTTNVENMSYMFVGSRFNTLDLNKFDTRNVTDMNSMFYNMPNIRVLDLHTFDTSKVTNMNSMFSLSNHLTTIYVSDKWNTNSVENSYNMFTETLGIVGQNGTTYNAINNDATYARVDTELTPGYLTLLGTKIDTNIDTVNFGTIEKNFSREQSDETLRVIRITNTGNTVITISNTNPTANGPFGTYWFDSSASINPGEYIDVQLRLADNSPFTGLVNTYNGNYVFTATNVSDPSDTYEINISATVVVANPPETYTVTFKDGNSVLDNRNIVSGDRITRPTPDPTKDGYTFAGWYSDESLNKIYNFVTPVTESIILYTKWVKPITNVTLNKTNVTLEIGKKLNLIATITPTDTTDSKTVTWTSSNTKVVTVDKSGNITAKNAGTATITVKTSNRKTASVKVTVPKIKAKSITYPKVKNQTYTGKQIKPSITLKYGNTKLKNGTDYKITYGTNKKTGKGTIKITFKGNYEGEKTITFYIVPKTVTVKKVTTPSKKTLKVTYKKVDYASGYEISYRVKGTSKWKTTTTTKLEKKITKLTSKKKYQVRVRAYKVVNNKKYYGAYSKTNTIKIK